MHLHPIRPTAAHGTWLTAGVGVKSRVNQNCASGHRRQNFVHVLCAAGAGVRHDLDQTRLPVRRSSKKFKGRYCMLSGFFALLQL